MVRYTLAVWTLAAACGGGGGSPPDAASTADADTRKVIPLESCSLAVDATVMDSASAFVPTSTTVPLNGIVKFVMTAEHTLIPNPLTTTDPALVAGRGQTRCFQFKAAGTYGFACGVHGFAGTITVP